MRRRDLLIGAAALATSAKAQIISGGGSGGGLDPVVSTFVSAVGSSNISSNAIVALDGFVKSGRSAGWWNSLIEVYPFIGQNLAASLGKLKTQLGGATSLVNNGFISADYSEGAGFGLGVAANSGKFLQTGAVPSALNLNEANLLLGMSCLDVSASVSSGWLLADSPAPGGSGNVIKIGDNTAGSPSVNMGFSRSGFSARVANWSSGSFSNVNCGILADQSSVMAAAINSTTELVLFKRVNGGTTFAGGKIGITVIGNALPTIAMQKSLSNAIMAFERAVRTAAGARVGAWGFFGDSLTFGSLATTAAKQFSNIIAAARNVAEINFGVPNSKLVSNVDGSGAWAVGGFQRYADLLNASLNLAKVLVMYGQNDWSADANVNGDPTLIADFQSKLTTILTALAAMYGAANVVNISTLFDPVTKPTKSTAWLAGVAGASAAVPGTKYLDCYTVLAGQGDPSSFITGGHLNDAGHALWASTILAAA